MLWFAAEVGNWALQGNADRIPTGTDGQRAVLWYWRFYLSLPPLIGSGKVPKR